VTIIGAILVAIAALSYVAYFVGVGICIAHEEMTGKTAAMSLVGFLLLIVAPLAATGWALIEAGSP
jgi:hypothetical protein